MTSTTARRFRTRRRRTSAPTARSRRPARQEPPARPERVAGRDVQPHGDGHRRGLRRGSCPACSPVPCTATSSTVRRARGAAGTGPGDRDASPRRGRGDLIRVPAGQTSDVSGEYRPGPTHPTTLAAGAYTVRCEYRNFTPRPDPQPGDPPVWFGEVPATTTSIFVGGYTFSGFLPPLVADLVVNSGVPVRFRC